MREVATFMRMYPAYQLRDVLNEFAVTFFALLNEGYRIRYSDAIMSAQLADLPHMKAEERKEFYQQMEWASMHPSDILKSSDEGSNPAEIKKLLGGR